jgi:hypothetical protein
MSDLVFHLGAVQRSVDVIIRDRLDGLPDIAYLAATEKPPDTAGWPAPDRWDAENAIGPASPVADEVATDAITQTFEAMAPMRRPALSTYEVTGTSSTATSS